MSKNAIVVVSRQSEWLDVISRLQNEMDIQPKYWVTYPDNHEVVKKRFPGIVAHERNDANRGVPPTETMHLNNCNHHGINFFGYSEELNTLVDQIDRIDIGESMVLGQKRRLADVLVSYWLNVLAEYKINFAIFGQPPHSMGNYSLYLALMIIDADIRIYRYTGLNNLHFVSDRLDNFPKSFGEAFRFASMLDNPIERLSERTRRAILEIRESKSQLEPWYIANKNERESRYARLMTQIEEQVDAHNVTSRLDFEKGPFIKETKINTFSRDGDRILERNFKVPGRELFDRPITATENKVYKIWSYGAKLGLKRKYDQLASNQLPEKYVYFAFNYQPERTTNPDGGLFSDHFRCFLVLDALLPNEYCIVIKEHPTQYSYVAMGERSRWPSYYDDFLRSRRCVFVSQSISSHELISKADATATITGTVGWETLLCSKPVFTFGAAWYALCPGVLDLSNQAANARIVKEFLETPVSDREIDAYALALETVGERVYTTPTIEKGFDEEVDQTDRLYGLLKDSLL